MTFPETRHTLILRIASGGGDADWREFLADYWEPVCRFVRHRGNLRSHDAEDISAQVFETLLRKQLLLRWSDSPVAKLRTLLCTVARNALSNRNRIDANRAQLLAEMPLQLSDEELDSGDESDFFYTAWVDELLHSASDSLMLDYHKEGRGDYFRVLYSRICEDLSNAEIAELLEIKLSDVDNYFRHARQRLLERIQESVREHVQRYSMSRSAEDDFQSEWKELGRYLEEHGGLEQSIRHAYLEAEAGRRPGWQTSLASGKLSLPSAVTADPKSISENSRRA